MEITLAEYRSKRFIRHEHLLDTCSRHEHLPDTCSRHEHLFDTCSRHAYLPDTCSRHKHKDPVSVPVSGVKKCHFSPKKALLVLF